MKAIALLFLYIWTVSSFGINYQPGIILNNTLPKSTELQANLRVVFFGDQGLGTNAINVLKAIKDWQPDFVVHTGDFDYLSNPASWTSQLDSVLGPDFPYFAAVGNHDALRWSGTTGYQQRLIDRLKRFGGDKFCTGEYGVNFACNYKGLLFVVSGVGTLGSNHAQFIDDTFTNNAAKFKVCNWHKNQRLYQTGDKTDETGYQVYDTCRKHGAIVSTSHEHSYSRTYLMSNFATQQIANKDAQIQLEAGKSFAFVSGLGGNSIRPWKSNLEKNGWWASTASSNNGVNYAALYCIFNVDGKVDQASCTFKDVRNKTWDNISIISKLSGTVPTPRANCPKDILERQISSRFAEISQYSTDGHIYLANGTETATTSSFRFDNVDVTERDISSAQLQVMGAEVGQGPATIVIRAMVNGRVTKSSVTWQLNDVEKDEVWNSPNIKDILVEALTLQGTQRSITLTLSGRGYISAYSSQTFPALAPSLLIHLNDKACF